MHLTIFWRVIFAQLTLIALILGMSLYALFQLHHLAGLSTALLETDSKSIEAEKHLLKIFLSQRRIAEYTSLRQTRSSTVTLSKAAARLLTSLRRLLAW